jgi:hypothetical protein
MSITLSSSTQHICLWVPRYQIIHSTEMLLVDVRRRRLEFNISSFAGCFPAFFEAAGREIDCLETRDRAEVWQLDLREDLANVSGHCGKDAVSVPSQMREGEKVIPPGPYFDTLGKGTEGIQATLDVVIPPNPKKTGDTHKGKKSKKSTSDAATAKAVEPSRKRKRREESEEDEEDLEDLRSQQQ